MADQDPQHRATKLSGSQIHQQLEALGQTCEVLQLRMLEFEQVLLELDNRLRNLQRGVAQSRSRVRPTLAKPRPGRQYPHLRSSLFLLLAACLGMFWIVFGRNPTTTWVSSEFNPTPQTPVDPSVSLQLIARGVTWLEVQSPSGQMLYYGLMQPGRLRFPIQSSLRIRAGRPDLVEVRVRDQARQLGDVGDVDWKQFSSI